VKKAPINGGGRIERVVCLRINLVLTVACSEEVNALKR
jgi:hypothetical protein